MNLSPLPIQKFFDNNGRPLDGGLLFTYVAGTSNKLATYIDAGGLTPNTNPIVLDFRGECRLWIDPTLSYKFVLSPPGDTDPPADPIWTVDNITAGPAQQDNSAVDTGSVNNIALSIPQISSPVAFTRIAFRAANTNTGPVTITINGGTTKNLRWQNIEALAGGEIQANGIYQAIYDGAQWQLQGPVMQPLSDGTVAAPALTFAGDRDTGMYHEGANEVRFAAGGALSFLYSTTRILCRFQIQGANGLVSAPGYSFEGDPNTGMFWNSSDEVRFAAGGALSLLYDTVRVRPILPIQGSDGSAGTPAFSFIGDPNTGVFNQDADAVGIASNAVEVARFDANATGGQTRFAIYDVDNGTLERVSVGAADSGGAGFKVLRIPN